MTITRYDTYKLSGIEWLGDVPEHWEITPIKNLLKQIIDTEHKTAPFYEDGTYLIVRTTNIKNGKLIFDKAKYTDYEGYKEWTKRAKPKAGDILFTREAPAGEACIIPEGIDICVGQRVVLFQVNKQKIVPFFIILSIYGGFSKSHISALSTGSTVAHFNMSDIKNIPILLPPLPEQTAIAHYLDTKTAAIDAKIALLAQKMDRYKELSKSLINETVCRGLDKNVQLKESGIEWIGAIPEHWEVKRLKDIGFLYSGLSGKSGEDFNQEASDNSRYYIPFTNIANNKYIDHNDFRTVVFQAEEKQNDVKKNDLFFLMSSEGYADIGKSAILIEEVNDVYLNSFCKGFRITNQAVFPIYLNYILNAVAFRNRFVVEGKGFTRINLKMEKVNDFNFIIPPLSEQTAIATYLDGQTGKIAAILTNLGLQIEGLKALRKTLINDVVTGKVKVSS